MQANTPLISVQNVSKIFSSEQDTGIKNINFELQKGYIYVILGESGCGKSTLLKCIYGLHTTDTGEIFCEGIRVLGPSEKLIPGHDSMRLVTQDAELNTYASVYDNIASQFSNRNLEEKRTKTEKIIDLLGLNHLKTHTIKKLSGGEQQRVALAKAMVSQPPILLMDEPFSQIDTLLKRQLRTDILKLKNTLGTTIIMVSHDPIDAYYLADEVIILKNGKLQQKGNLASIKEKPSNAYVAKLFGGAIHIKNTISWQQFANRQQLDSGSQVCIYPEDIEIFTEASEPCEPALIKEIRTLQFYQEVKLTCWEQEIICIQMGSNLNLKNGMQVWISAKKYHLF